MQFANKQPPPLVPGNTRRIAYEWFARNKVQTKSSRQSNSLLTLFGSQRLRRVFGRLYLSEYGGFGQSNKYERQRIESTTKRHGPVPTQRGGKQVPIVAPL